MNMKLLSTFAAFGFALSGVAAFGQSNEWIPLAKDGIILGGDELNARTNEKIEDILLRVIDKVDETRLAIERKKIPTLKKKLPLGKTHQETLASALAYLEEEEQLIEQLDVEVQQVSDLKARLTLLDQYAQGAEVTLEKVAQILLLPAPIQAMRYYELSMINVQDLELAVNHAISTVNSYDRELTAARTRESIRASDVRGLISALKPGKIGCPSSGSKSTKSCYKQWLDSLGTGGGDGTAVAQ
jgi:vacuolar-type H+-ATPase subunit I/STV1